MIRSGARRCRAVSRWRGNTFKLSFAVRISLGARIAKAENLNIYRIARDASGLPRIDVIISAIKRCSMILSDANRVSARAYDKSKKTLTNCCGGLIVNYNAARAAA